MNANLEAASPQVIAPKARCRAVPSDSVKREVGGRAEGLIHIWQPEVIRRQFVESECPTASCIIIGPPDPSHPQFLSKCVYWDRLSSEHPPVALYLDEAGNRQVRSAGRYEDDTLVPAAYVLGLTLLSGLVEWQPEVGEEITLTLRITIEGVNGEFGWCEVVGRVDHHLLSIDWTPVPTWLFKHVTWLNPGDEVPDFFIHAFPAPSPG